MRLILPLPPHLRIPTNLLLERQRLLPQPRRIHLFNLHPPPILLIHIVQNLFLFLAHSSAEKPPAIFVVFRVVGVEEVGGEGGGVGRFLFFFVDACTAGGFGILFGGFVGCDCGELGSYGRGGWEVRENVRGSWVGASLRFLLETLPDWPGSAGFCCASYQRHALQTVQKTHLEQAINIRHCSQRAR